MSKKRRQSYNGCSLESHRGWLRLRFRAWLPNGTRRHVARATGLSDTQPNRTRLRPLVRLVGAAVEAGRPLAEIDAVIGRLDSPPPPDPARRSRGPRSGPTVTEYYQRWFAEQERMVRRALARDYRRHMNGYVLPALGGIPLAELKAADLRALQAELLSRGLSVKYVRNILSGTFRAMIQQARADELIVRDVFAGLKWPEWSPPEPDPFTPEQRTKIIEWFRQKRFGFHPGAGSMNNRWLSHPPYHAFVFTLFWTGLRPSEAAGLTWSDIDLPRQRLQVRRSRHMYAYAAPKVRQARRQVELFPDVIRVLAALKPPAAASNAPVFTNTKGRPIEPNAFLRHWYECLRELKIRRRGLYCTKDTYVTTALAVGVKIAWLEQQTGVRYETLRRHYGRWMPLEGQSELRRFAASDPSLF